MIHENQDNDLENRDQSEKNTVSKKGNIQGYSEIGDGTRTRRGQGKDKDKARTRTRRGQGKDKERTRTRWRGD